MLIQVACFPVHLIVVVTESLCLNGTKSDKTIPYIHSPVFSDVIAKASTHVPSKVGYVFGTGAFTPRSINGVITTVLELGVDESHTKTGANIGGELSSGIDVPVGIGEESLDTESLFHLGGVVVVTVSLFGFRLGEPGIFKFSPDRYTEFFIEVIADSDRTAKGIVRSAAAIYTVGISTF